MKLKAEWKLIDKIIFDMQEEQEKQLIYEIYDEIKNLYLKRFLILLKKLQLKRR